MIRPKVFHPFLNHNFLQISFRMSQISFDLSSILVDKSDVHDAPNSYWNCEMKCRRLTKRFLCYGCIHLSIFLPVLVFVFIDIFKGEFDGSAYNLPFNTVVPFDMHTVSGLLFVWFLQLNESFTYNVHMITTTTQFVCFCYYIFAICDHFNHLIDSIHFDSQQIQMVSNRETRQQMWLNARVKLQRAVEIHVDVYE